MFRPLDSSGAMRPGVREDDERGTSPDGLEELSRPCSEAALDNITNNASRAPHKEHEWRWSLLRTAKRLAPDGDRVGMCRTFVVGDTPATVAKTRAGVRWQGLNRCGAHHYCPYCAYVYRAEWGHRIAWLVSRCKSMGMMPYFVTITVPHTAADKPKDTLDILSYAWSKCFTGRRKKYMEEELGLWSFVKALDHTVRANGHHFHIHALLWFRRELSDLELTGLDGDLFKTVSAAVDRKNGRECSRRAFYIEQVRDDLKSARYLGKLSPIPLELTSPMTKKGKGRTVWGILAEAKGAVDAGEAPSPRDVQLWNEYRLAMHRRRAIDLGQPARDLLKEMPEEEMPETETLAEVGRKTYKTIRKAQLEASVLEAFEHADPTTRAEAEALLKEAEERDDWRERLGMIRTALGHLLS